MASTICYMNLHEIVSPEKSIYRMVIICNKENQFKRLQDVQKLL